MFRTMLYQVFQRRSYSKYYKPQPGTNAKAAANARTPGTPLPSPWPKCYGPMSRDPDIVHLVKTHDWPEDNAKAIYVVRNGLAAIRSYKHFLRDVEKCDFSLDQVILGEPLYGSWGSHLDAWNPPERPNTLVIRYEDLVERPEQELQKVAEFTGFTKQAEWVNNFDELHAAHPNMYRQGPGIPPEEGFTGEQQQLFWSLHGDWMAKFGYSRPVCTTARALRAVLVERFHTADAVLDLSSPRR